MNTNILYGTTEQYVTARAGMYASAAPLALVIYDYLLTLPSEIKYIWPSQMSVMKVLYFMTKYLIFFDITAAVYSGCRIDHRTPGLSHQECRVFVSTANWMLLVGVAIAEVIMMMRTWGLWERSKRVAMILGTMAMVAFFTALLTEGLFTRSLTFVSFPPPSQPSCFLLSGNRLIVINPALVMIVEAGVFLLTLVKALRDDHLSLLVWSQRTNSLIYVFYRDGLSSYVYLLGTVSIALEQITRVTHYHVLPGITLFNLIVMIAFPAYGTDLVVAIQRVFHSCISARVIINLREAAEQENATSMFDWTGFADVVFADALAEGRTSQHGEA
ncbi:hypothetical protein EIP91_002278 [Steccherinum ochraceum]|uniref:DUF6533 domain-containing protein n=1 Tax=Steccherinum ochraceum TaxID=92696 RepID=A0A4R0REG4_9APHY|nr:hypothetical protein EIP91_002278 [Steccherinum ochraceum]